MAWAIQHFPTVTSRFLREGGIEDPMSQINHYAGACSDPKSLEGELHYIYSIYYITYLSSMLFCQIVMLYLKGKRQVHFNLHKAYWRQRFLM